MPTIELSAGDIQTLQSGMRGEVLTPDTAGFHPARSLFNGMIDRRPAVIARCAGVSDVLRALEFGTGKSLPIAIRCGGHSVAGFSVCEGGLMLDLSAMNSVYVDPAAGTARAEGGVNWGQFDVETQAFGLATTGGLVRSTGIGGLTLSGGHGFLMRKFGLACDNLLSANVVTADGRFLTASALENPELFWALRGGGGNFGVVTSFEFRLHRVGPVTGGVIAFPFDQAAQLLKFYDEFSAAAPDELGTLAALATLPNGMRALVNLACYCGSPEDGEKVLAPLRAAAAPLMDQLQTMPYTAIQSIVENFNPRGKRNYWKMVYLNELSAEAIEFMTSHYAANTAPLTHIVIYSFGGAVGRVADEDTAVSHRGARHAAIAIGMWEDAEDDERQIGWVRDFATGMAPFASGGFYPNYDADSAADRVELAFGSAKYARLAAAKRAFDPANIFRLNQNIQPR
jgi:FAD/FMN-containing dehydrogenase